MDQSIFLKLVFAVVLLGTLGTSTPVSKIERPTRSLLHGPQMTDIKRDTPKGHLAEKESFRSKRELMSKIRPKITDITENENLRSKRSLLDRPKRTDVRSKRNGHLAEGERFRPKRELMSKIRPKITDFTQKEGLRSKRSLVHRPKRTDVKRDAPNRHLAESESFRPKRKLMSKIRPKITDFTQKEGLRPKRTLVLRPKRTDVKRDTPNRHLAESESFRPKREIMSKILPKITDFTQNEHLRPKNSLLRRPKRTEVKRDTPNRHLAESESFRPKREIMSKILPKITDFTQNEHLRPKKSLLRRPKGTEVRRDTPNGPLVEIETFRPKRELLSIIRPNVTYSTQNGHLRPKRSLLHRPKRTDGKRDTTNGHSGIRHNTGHAEGTQNTKRINAKHEKESVLINIIRHKKSLFVRTEAHKKALREQIKTTRVLEKNYLNQGSTFHGKLSVLEDRLMQYLCRKREQQSDRKKALCSEIELLESYTRFWGNSALPPAPAPAPAF